MIKKEISFLHAYNKKSSIYLANISQDSLGETHTNKCRIMCGCIRKITQKNRLSNIVCKYLKSESKSKKSCNFAIDFLCYITYKYQFCQKR